MDPYTNSGYGDQGYHPQYSDSYPSGGYSQNSDYYSYSQQATQGTTTGNNASSGGQPMQQPPPLSPPQQPPPPPSQTSQTQGPPSSTQPPNSAAAGPGYSYPRTDTYDAGYAGNNYYGYPPTSASTTNYSAASGQPISSGGNPSAPPYHGGGSGYSNVPATNKSTFDRPGEYAEGPGSSNYDNAKNPYGESYGGSTYKSRDTPRNNFPPLSPKDGTTSFDNYGGRGSDGGYKDFGAEDSVVHTSTDTIYISNLSKDVTEQKLLEFFGGLGKIKIDKRTQKPKIWIYYDKISGLPKGDATLTYEDPDASKAAISWFHNKEFLGQTIKVEMSVRKMVTAAFRGRNNKPRGRGFSSGGRGSERGTSGGRGGGPLPREGDWTCDSCSSNNFARRTECYKCHAPRSDAPSGDNSYGSRYGSSSSSSSSRGGYRGRRGGGPSYGGSNRYSNDDERNYGGGSGYRNSESGYGGGYDQGYGRPNKQDDRRDNSRYRPY